jgi:hypothetical protein
VICSDREALQIAEARCAELEARVRELEVIGQAALQWVEEGLPVMSALSERCQELETRLAALTEAARQTLDCAKCGEDYGICCACTARLRAALEEGK